LMNGTNGLKAKFQRGKRHGDAGARVPWLLGSREALAA
jgi:hypothetical protein